MGKLGVAELLISRSMAWPRDQESPLAMTNGAGNMLHEAVHNCHDAMAVALPNVDPSQGDILNERMESPLHMAAHEGLV